MRISYTSTARLATWTLVFLASVTMESSALPFAREASSCASASPCLIKSLRGGGAISKDDSTVKTSFTSQEKQTDSKDKGPAPPQQRAKRSLTFGSLPSLPSFAASLLRHTTRPSQEYLPGSHFSTMPSAFSSFVHKYAYTYYPLQSQSTFCRCAVIRTTLCVCMRA